MGEIQRQSIYNSLVAYLGILLGFLNMGILFPFVLTTEQIGLYAVIAAIGQVGSNMFRFGVPNIAMRYLPFFRNDEVKLSQFIGFQIFLVALGGALFVLLYSMFKPMLASWFWGDSLLFDSYSQLAVPFTLFMLAFELFFGFCRANILTVAAGFARDVLFRMIIFALIIAFHFQLISFHQFIWIYSFAYAIPTLFLILYLVSKHKLPVSFRFVSLGNLKTMFVYGCFVSMGSLSMVLLNELDKIMITGMVDLDATGIYAVSAFFGAVIVAPARSLFMIASPIIAQFMKDGEMEKIARVYSKSAINLLAVGLLIYIGLCVNLDNVFTILPEKYATGYYVVVFIGLSKLFEMGTGVNGDIILNSKYFRYDLLFNFCLAVLAICTNLILIPMYGITGAAVATAISIFLFNTFRGIFIYWKFRMQPYSIKTAYCILIGLLVLSINHFLPIWDNVYFDIIMRSTIAVGIYVPLLLAFNISPDINGMVTKLLAQAKGRK
jgi:O-antigen/teichoic acid export membrane protein